MVNLELPRTIAATVTTSGTLTAGKHTPADATTAPLTLTLPAATAGNAGAHLSVEKVDATGNAVTVSGSIRGTTSTIVLVLSHESVEFRADAAGSWWPIAGHKTKTSLDALYLTSPAFTGTPTIGGAAVAKTSDITTAIAGLVNGASTALDTLAEIDAQLAADEGSAAALAVTVAQKSLSLPVNVMSANGTAVIGARNAVNASAGPIAVTMPTPTAVGQHLIIERSDASTTTANVITITGTIRGTANTVVTLAAVGAANEGGHYVSESLTSWAIAGSIKPKAVLDTYYAPKPTGTAASGKYVDGGTGAWTVLPTIGAAPAAASTTAGPLTRFLAALPARQSRTVMVAVLGDSNANGSGTSTAQATSWLDRFGAYLHSAYPLDSGAVQPNWVNFTSFSTTTPGIQIYNNGKPGARSDQYLASPTEINAFAAAKTALYIHIIGTNDWYANVDPAVFKTNVSNAITAINTASTVPTVHVLVRMFARSQGIYTYPWTSYGAKLAELAAASPTNVLCFDFEQAFANATNGAIGADGTDPWGFITGPHLTDQGQMFFADLMRDAFDLRPAGAGVTAANPALTNTAAPTISGTTTQGQVLTATTGSWSATPESYSYQWNRNGNAIPTATTSTYTLAAGDVGTTITVTVQAAKTYYTSGWANSSATATIASSGGSTAPGAPTGLTASAGNTTATLAWTAPASNGGSAITDYLVEYLPSGGSWATFNDGVSTATGATVTGLTNGVVYTFRVSAINSIGTSTASGTATATPAAGVLTNSTVPTITGTPTQGQTLTASNGTWSATPDSYAYVWKRSGTAISGATASTYTLAAGDVGTTITVTVTAAKAGYSSASATSAATATIAASTTVPGVPTGLGATAGDTTTALSWTAPASNGGAAITDYLVEYQPLGGSWATFNDGVSTATSATVTGLTDGTTYAFRVSAINSVGTGTPSATASATPAAAGGTTTTETWTGTDGAAWPAQWTVHGATATIVGNRGRLVTTSYWTGALLSGMTATTGDFNVVVDWSMVGNTSNATVIIGMSDAINDGSAKPKTGFSVNCTVVGTGNASGGGTVGGQALGSYAAGTETVVNQSFATVNPAGTGFTTRIKRTGTTLQARTWGQGTTEPGTWAVTGTVASPSLAGKGFLSGGDNNTITTEFDNYSITA